MRNPIKHEYVLNNGSGQTFHEEWRVDDKFHRADEPTVRVWTVVDGYRHLNREIWFQNGQLHRVGGPAIQWTVVEDVQYTTHEEWCQDGEHHRTDGPSSVQWTVVDGVRHLAGESWRQKGEYHRDGFLPAIAGKYYKGGRQYSLNELHFAGSIIRRFLDRVMAYRRAKKKAFTDTVIGFSGYFSHLGQLVFQYI